MSKTIFLVEDDDSLSEALSILLRDEGFKVQSFYDGIRVETQALIKKPGLIILDYRLPKENGLMLLQKLRKNNKLRNIPILVMSATQPEIKQEALRAGANGYITKPFSLKPFLKMIQNLMQ